MKTIVELFETSVGRFADNVYLLEKKEDKYLPTTYRETRELVLQMAAGLHTLGMKKGDRCGLIADGQNAWIISELGILYAGGINVPLSVKLTAQELQFRLEHSGCKMVIVSKEHADKVEEIRDKLPELEHIIYIDGKKNKLTKDIDYQEVLSEGKKFLETNSVELEQIWKNIQPDDLANISYTSGTTANPKGIMLSHLNYAANVVQGHTLMDMYPDWKTLAVLPWDHAFAHTACLYCFMYKGAAVASVKTGKNWLRQTWRRLRKGKRRRKKQSPSAKFSLTCSPKTPFGKWLAHLTALRREMGCWLSWSLRCSVESPRPIGLTKLQPSRVL